MKELKCEEPYFSDIFNGKKNIEIRLNDYPYQVGETIRLVEYDKDKGYLSRSIVMNIANIITIHTGKAKIILDSKYSYWSEDEIEKYGLVVLELK